MTVVCPTCNTEHEGRELIVLSAGGKKVVKPAAHLAPCGRVCRGAPVPVDWVVTEWHDSGCDCSEYVAPRGGWEMNGTFQAMRRMFTSGDRRRLRDLCREERGSLPWTHGGVHEARAVRMRAWEAARDAYDAVWAEHAEFQGLPRVCPPGDDMTDEEHAEFGSRPWRL